VPEPVEDAGGEGCGDPESAVLEERRSLASCRCIRAEEAAFGATVEPPETHYARHIVGDRANRDTLFIDDSQLP
jgi:hypothetical protein